MAFWLAAVIVLLALGLGPYLPDTYGSQCRCGPQDNCWPSPAAWSALNDTVGGHLVQLRPVGTVCHEAQYSNGSCSELIQNFRNTTWRVDNPGKFNPMLWSVRGNCHPY